MERDHEIPEGKLPDEWRRKVLAAMRGDIAAPRIFSTKQSRNDWEALFPDEFYSGLYDAVGTALEDPEIRVVEVLGMREDAEVYHFFLQHRRTKVYVKIGLTTDANMVILYSSHRPLKGDSL